MLTVALLLMVISKRVSFLDPQSFNFVSFSDAPLLFLFPFLSKYLFSSLSLLSSHFHPLLHYTPSDTEVEKIRKQTRFQLETETKITLIAH